MSPSGWQVWSALSAEGGTSAAVIGGSVTLEAARTTKAHFVNLEPNLAIIHLPKEFLNIILLRSRREHPRAQREKWNLLQEASLASSPSILARVKPLLHRLRFLSTCCDSNQALTLAELEG